MDKDLSERRASTDPLLAAIVAYCRRTGMAESTFGRRVVNDGKFVSRLRSGGRITTQTNDRVKAFIGGAFADDESPVQRKTRTIWRVAARKRPHARRDRRPPPAKAKSESRFRFYDNRQKYLLFVSTCTEKWVVAQRIEMELANLKPRPPALRMFDAGVGDGTILARVMRSMHDRFPTVPFYIVGQGDQSRGRPPGARENGGPLLRASVHGARHDQHVLLGVAVAAAELARRRERPRVARARALRRHRRPVRAADHGPAALPRAELDCEDQQGERQSRLRAPRRARDLPRRPQAAARCRPARSKAPCAPISTW